MPEERSICEVHFEFRNDDGDRYYRVTKRQGRSGECPPTDVLYDGHAFDDAQRVMNRTLREVRRKRDW